jgi:lipid A 3-O-deacylase
MMKRILFAATWLSFFAWSANGENVTDNTVTNEVSNLGLFEYSRYEATLTSGALFSPFIATGGRPTINYTITEVQFGYKLSDVKGHGWSRGNFELVGDGFGSAIFYGSGSYIAGMTIWMRYNFVPQGWRVVPFVQAGMGVTSTDIDRSIVGQPFNFNLNIGIGARYLFSKHWSLNAECRYQHISNADSGEHNLGINSIGPIVGVSYFF